ncbi:MAG TPA: SRPBCC family protein [Myxococcota bacterium]|jgi:carbon monoxide dehydrogenase subunit G
MASIRREIRIDARPETAWDALRDVGALHERLVPGFVTAVRLEEGARIVTFGNGLVARELIVDLDDEQRRLVWSAAGGRLTHHNASAQVFPDGAAGCRFVWIADLLPDAMAPAIAAMIEQGIAIIRQTLERSEHLASAAGRGAPGDSARSQEPEHSRDEEQRGDVAR